MHAGVTAAVEMIIAIVVIGMLFETAAAEQPNHGDNIPDATAAVRFCSANPVALFLPTIAGVRGRTKTVTRQAHAEAAGAAPVNPDVSDESYLGLELGEGV